MNMYHPVAAAFLLLALGPGPARATCTVLPSVPAVITQSGSYCLDRSYEVRLDSGDAIAIRSSHVTLDLAGHTVVNTADVFNQATGIGAQDRSNVTVRGGTLVGFGRGVALGSSSGKCQHRTTGPYRVEDATLIDSRFAAIDLQGCAMEVRRNRVFDTGISLEYAAHGIIADGTSVSVVDNDVQRVLANETYSVGIQVFAPRGVVERNRVQSARNGLVLSSMVVYRDNTVVEFPGRSYQGGIDGGGNR